MTKRKIILVPDEILKKKSEKIEKLTNKEKQLADDLFETMYKNNGIGLAAVQVGVLRRMIVIDVSKKDEEKKPLCLINPVIKSYGKDRSIYEEGCLSIPETFIEIERPKTCIVEYIDISGNKTNISAFDISAACSAFIYLLEIGNQFIQTGKYKNILLVGSDVMSCLLDKSPAGRATGVLFGDGGGAGMGSQIDDRERTAWKASKLSCVDDHTWGRVLLTCEPTQLK